jgi:DnaJ-domain-containing protein 1
MVQGMVLVGLVAAIYALKKRARDRDEALMPNLKAPDFRTGVNSTPPEEPSEGTSDYTKPLAQIESAFPTWQKETPPHEILGVRENANEKTIESAYKKLLKKYHPDRFAPWGKAYQNRAHHVVLLLQRARDAMLSPRDRK